MSTIRKAVIDLELRTSRSKLEAPDVGPAERAYKREAEAADKATEATKEVTDATKAHSSEVKRSGEEVRSNLEHMGASHEQFASRSFTSLNHAGHGVLSLARGIALMSASGEKDTQKMLEQFVKIEAAVSILKGGAKLAAFAAEFGPVGIAVSAVTALATAGAIAWNRWETAGERAAEKVREEMKKTREEIGRYRAEQEAGAEERAGVRGIETDKAGLGTSRQALAALRKRDAELARQQSAAGGKAGAFEFGRAKAGFGEVAPAGFEPVPVGGKFETAKAEEDAKAAREEELKIQKERNEIQKQILELQKDEADKQARQAKQGMRMLRPFLPQGAGEGFDTMADIGNERKQDELTKAYRNLMSDMLDTTKELQMELNSVKAKQRQAENAQR